MEIKAKVQWEPMKRMPDAEFDRIAEEALERALTPGELSKLVMEAVRARQAEGYWRLWANGITCGKGDGDVLLADGMNLVEWRERALRLEHALLDAREDDRWSKVHSLKPAVEWHNHRQCGLCTPDDREAIDGLAAKAEARHG